MSFGFRKSIRLAPGIRLNLSRRGAGLSVGPKHVKASANTRGQRRTSLSLLGFFFRRTR